LKDKGVGGYLVRGRCEYYCYSFFVTKGRIALHEVSSKALYQCLVDRTLDAENILKKGNKIDKPD
jgi:hypothetical protein